MKVNHVAVPREVNEEVRNYVNGNGVDDTDAGADADYDDDNGLDEDPPVPDLAPQDMPIPTTQDHED